MQKMYEEFRERLFNPHAYPISDTEIWLNVETRDEYWPIRMKDMQFIPRKGEEFTVKFIEEVGDGRTLTVESITHEIENGVHRINIFVENIPLK